MLSAFFKSSLHIVLDIHRLYRQQSWPDTAWTRHGYTSSTSNLIQIVVNTSQFILLSAFSKSCVHIVPGIHCLCREL